MVSRPKLLIFDIDGVLTDGRTLVSPGGEETKRLNFHDLDALTKMMRSGVPLAFVTGESGSMVDTIARRFGVEKIVSGAKDKLAAVQRLAQEHDLALSDLWYVGDSDRDAPALSAVGLGLAPCDATAAAKAAAHRVLERAAGEGVGSEIADLLFRLSLGDTLALQADMRAIVQDSIRAHIRLLDESLPVLSEVAVVLTRALQTGRKLLFFGNGGSAADAQHVAGEFVGRFLRESPPYAAIALTTDSSILTAVGNDWEFVDVFSRQVRALARSGDVVVGISTSGNSPNVVKGLEAGKTLGATCIGFTGEGGGKLPSVCDICFCAPADTTPRIQELHILAWHAICELVEQSLMADGRAQSQL